MWTIPTTTKKITSTIGDDEEAPSTLEVQQNTSTSRGDETQVTAGDVAGMFDPADAVNTDKTYASGDTLGTGTTADVSFGYTDPATSAKWGGGDLQGYLDAKGSWGDPGALLSANDQQSATADITQTYVDPTTGETWGDDLGPALDGFRDDVRAQSGPPPPADPYAGDIGAMVEDWIAQQFGGVRDTAADEALIAEQQRIAMGGSLADNAARMGRAGFAASGANAAIGGDIRRQAALDAAREMLDVRERARQEELSRASTALGGHLNMSRLASEDARREAMLQLLQEMMDGAGQPDDAAPSGGVGSAPPVNVVDIAIGEDSFVGDLLDKDPGTMTGVDGHEPPTGGRSWWPAGMLTEAERMESTGELVRYSEDAQNVYFKTPDGKVVVVAKG